MLADRGVIWVLLLGGRNKPGDDRAGYCSRRDGIASFGRLLLGADSDHLRKPRRRYRFVARRTTAAGSVALLHVLSDKAVADTVLHAR